MYPNTFLQNSVKPQLLGLPYFTTEDFLKLFDIYVKRETSECNTCILQDSNIGIPDVEGKTPLHWAASSRDAATVNCVKLLLVSIRICSK